MSVILSLRLSGRDRKSTPRLPTGAQDFWANKKKLDAVTKTARVPSLFSFIHSLGEEAKWVHKAMGSPDIGAMDEPEESRYHERAWQMTPHAGKWHDASDGLRTLEAILAHLKEHGPDAIPGVERDLKALRQALLSAAKAGVGFRLAGE